MATLTIRDLPEEVRTALKARAAEHNRSMEAEVREILRAATASEIDFIGDWIAATAMLRGDFLLPARAASTRAVTLS